jgi:soluble lytic murein transglycosylase-like protein/tetratricopeptide (TPR) repeat protein
VAAGRYWHAQRAAGPLPREPRWLEPADARLRLEIVEGVGAWSQVDAIVARVREADTLPVILRLAAGRDEQAGRWAAAVARYRRLAVLPRATPHERSIAAVRLAVALEHHGSEDSAAAAWRRGAQTLPELADWLTLRGAEEEPDTAAAFAALASPMSPGAAAAVDSFIADRRVAAGNLEGALALYLRHGRVAEAAQVEESLGRSAVARRRADAVLEANPSRPQAVLAATFLATTYDPLTVDELLAIARAYRARGDLRSAERYAGRAARASDTAFTPWIELASVAAARHRSATAREALAHAAALLRRRPGVPATVLAPATVRVLGAAGRWASADSSVTRLARTNPGDSNVAAAVALVARHDLIRGADARVAFLDRLLVRDFGEAAATNGARLRLALEAYAAGDHDSAAAGIAAVLAHGATGEVARAAGYWDARLRLEAHDPGAAARLRAIAAAEPLGYYGVRARELLDEPLPLTPDSMLPRPRAGLSLAQADERIRLLVDAGLGAEASAEALGWIADTGASPALLASVAAAAAGVALGREAILLGNAAGARAPLTRSVAIALFPRPYWKVFQGEAAEQCLDPLLLTAVVRQESRFQVLARSSAGARGLSQLLPRTARELNRRLRLGPWNPRLLDVPDYNLHIGARYLREREAHARLPVHVLIASYNSGPVRVARWRQWPGVQDPDLFVAHLSVPETQDYVRSVYANYLWYRQLYAAGEGAR